MSEHENLEIVKSGYDAFGRGDIDALLGLLDENIDWVSSGPPELPTSGRHRGRQAVVEFFQALNAMFDFQRFEPKEFIAQNDRVIVLGSDTSTVRATGKVLDTEWVHVFRVQDGRIVSLQDFFDTAAIVAELRAAQAGV